MAGWRRGPTLAVDAVCLKAGQVLLVRRGRPPFRGAWALPGGFVEADETVEQAVVRELREETGLRAHPVAIVGVYSGPERDPRKPVTTVTFLMAGVGRRPPKGSDDAADAAWVRLDAAHPLAFDHEAMLRDALGVVDGKRGATPAALGKLARRPRRRTV